ncbi:ABC transporter permease [Actinotalea sp. K2]|uniref:ABC transporter permease n=1 Tax=Actinotalea sp. K2 TaxID=2939438 RepID=UPI002016ED9E|nr:ABC transporter permease [Actinotalea sp. K2]MCL3862644.1 ABC transporter permease [Actinotalea sp. K2]
MRAALVTEYRKLVTTRLWWALLLVMGVYMAFLGAMMGFVFGSDDAGASLSGGMGDPGAAAALDPAAVAQTVYTLSTSFGYVFPVIVGALAVTGEFRHMTVTPTFLAEPRRSVVLGAKLLASIPLGVLFGLVGTLATVAGGAPVLALLGEDPMLTDPQVLRSIGLCVLVLTVWTTVGVGFGAALPNQVAAVVVLLAFTQFVEPIVRMVLGVVDAMEIAKFMPGAAGEAVTGVSFYSATGLGDLLVWWQGLLVLIAYGLVLALVGRLTTLRKDVT